MYRQLPLPPLIPASPISLLLQIHCLLPHLQLVSGVPLMSLGAVTSFKVMYCQKGKLED